MIQTVDEDLREACANGDEGKAQVLIGQGADVNSYNKMNGWTALHWASYRGHRGLVMYLLNKGADPTIKNKKGETVLNMLSKHCLDLLDGKEVDDAKQYPLPSQQETLNNLPIVPNYIRNPEFPYLKDTSTAVPSSGTQQGSVAQGDSSTQEYQMKDEIKSEPGTPSSTSPKQGVVVPTVTPTPEHIQQAAHLTHHPTPVHVAPVHVTPVHVTPVHMTPHRPGPYTITTVTNSSRMVTSQIGTRLPLRPPPQQHYRQAVPQCYQPQPAQQRIMLNPLHSPMVTSDYPIQRLDYPLQRLPTVYNPQGGGEVRMIIHAAPQYRPQAGMMVPGMIGPVHHTTGPPPATHHHSGQPPPPLPHRPPFTPTVMHHPQTSVPQQIINIPDSSTGLGEKKDFSTPQKKSPPTSPSNTSVASSPTTEATIKVRKSGNEDFFEVELCDIGDTYTSLVQCFADELDIKGDAISKIRKLPNILIRKDRDVKRIKHGAEFEVELQED